MMPHRQKQQTPLQYACRPRDRVSGPPAVALPDRCHAVNLGQPLCCHVFFKFGRKGLLEPVALVLLP